MPSASETRINTDREVPAAGEALIAFPKAQSTFMPRPGDALSAMGSPLAERLARHLSQAPFAQDKALATLAATPLGLLQELRRAVSGASVAATTFISAEGKTLIDPAMGAAAGTADAEALIQRRQLVSERLKQALQHRLFLIVLEHTETWYDQFTDEALSVRPSAELLRRLPQRFAYRPPGHGEVVEQIFEIHRLLLEHGPADAHVLIAVDPTPLKESNRLDDPIIATMETKALLRSAMAEAARALPGIDYLPLLESALWSEPLAVWTEGRAEICDAMVATLAERVRGLYLPHQASRPAAKVMGLVEQLNRGARPAETVKPSPPPAKRPEGANIRAVQSAKPAVPPAASAQKPASAAVQKAAKSAPPAAAPSAPPAERRFLFIAGCPRSGTTALGDLLNVHARVAIGKERFKNVLNMPNLDPPYGPSYYTTERFFDLRETDTNVRDDKLYKRLADKYAACLYVGDKVPRYYARFNILSERFPGARFLVISRKIEEVAQSWEARAKNPSDHWPEANGALKAVEHWNDANRKTVAWLHRLGDRMRVVHYERLFSGNRDSLVAILDWLGLEMTEKLDAAFAKFTADWETRANRPTRLTPEQQKFIAENADFACFQAIVAKSL